MGRQVQKHGPQIQAQHREVLSAHECLECGHLVTDHHRAGGGWHNGIVEHQRGERDGCIGAKGTCPCRRFVQPHKFTRHSVGFGRAS